MAAVNVSRMRSRPAIAQSRKQPYFSPTTSFWCFVSVEATGKELVNFTKIPPNQYNLPFISIRVRMAVCIV